MRASGVLAYESATIWGWGNTASVFAFFLCPETEWSISNLIHFLQSVQHNSLTTCIQASPQGDQNKWSRAVRNHVLYMKIDQAVGRGQTKNSLTEWETKPVKQWEGLRQPDVVKERQMPTEEQREGRDGMVCFGDSDKPSVHPLLQNHS